MPATSVAASRSPRSSTPTPCRRRAILGRSDGAVDQELLGRVTGGGPLYLRIEGGLAPALREHGVAGAKAERRRPRRDVGPRLEDHQDADGDTDAPHADAASRSAMVVPALIVFDSMTDAPDLSGTEGTPT